MKKSSSFFSGELRKLCSHCAGVSAKVSREIEIKEKLFSSRKKITFSRERLLSAVVLKYRHTDEENLLVALVKHQKAYYLSK